MISIIAAIGNNYELGKDNDLIWHLPADLQHFKKMTSGHYIIMGRKTFESIGKPLPNRTSIIISRNPEYDVAGCLTATSLEAALDLAKDQEKVFIIGGAQIYQQAMEQKLADQLDITRVEGDFEADAFFPEIRSKDWMEIARDEHQADDKNKYNYAFIRYQKID